MHFQLGLVLTQLLQQSRHSWGSSTSQPESHLPSLNPTSPCCPRGDSSSPEGELRTVSHEHPWALHGPLSPLQVFWFWVCLLTFYPPSLPGLWTSLLFQDGFPSSLILSHLLERPCVSILCPLFNCTRDTKVIDIRFCTVCSLHSAFFIHLSLRRRQLFSRYIIHSTAGLCFQSA